MTKKEKPFAKEADLCSTFIAAATQDGKWTAWLPTPREIEAIVMGAPVHVRILGTQHPPIMVEVGEVPE